MCPLHMSDKIALLGKRFAAQTAGVSQFLVHCRDVPLHHRIGGEGFLAEAARESLSRVQSHMLVSSRDGIESLSTKLAGQTTWGSPLS